MVWSTKEVKLYLQTRYLIGTRRKYRSAFGPKNTPLSKAISRLAQNFIVIGTTLKQRSNATVKKIIEKIELSIRRLALGPSRLTCQEKPLKDIEEETETLSK